MGHYDPTGSCKIYSKRKKARLESDAAYIIPLEYSGKVSESSSSEERCFNGDGLDRKRTCSCGMWMLILSLIACSCICVLMLATNFFTVLVQMNLTLRNNSVRYEIWRKPPVQAVFRVYLFNYTNIEAFEAMKDKKLRVEELGPYAYIESMERVNVTHHSNGTLTYTDKKLYRFAPELSNGTESDIVVVPNIPFMAVMALMKNQGILSRLGLLTMLKSMKATPFLSLQVSEFLWGYQDHLSTLTSHVLTFKYKVPFVQFGIFSQKNGTQTDRVTIYTGETDIMKTGVVSEYNFKPSLDYWHTRECNRIDGTDGSIYPPSTIERSTILHLYVQDFCRRLPFVFNTSKIDQHGIPVYRYNLASDAFDNGNRNPENRCFCNRNASGLDCLPAGVFNVSPCAFGGPLITSFPHFLHGNPALREDIEGLQPREDIHETFVEIDPKLALPLSGKSRFQLNVMLTKSPGINRTPYKDRTILPVSWMDYGLDRLSDDLVWLTQSVLLFVEVAEQCLSYGFIIATAVILALIVRRLMPKKKLSLLRKNLEASTFDMPLMVPQEKV